MKSPKAEGILKDPRVWTYRRRFIGCKIWMLPSRHWWSWGICSTYKSSKHCFSVRKTLIRLKDPEMMAMLQSEPQLAAALSGGAFGCWDLFGVWRCIALFWGETGGTQIGSKGVCNFMESARRGEVCTILALSQYLLYDKTMPWLCGAQKMEECQCFGSKCESTLAKWNRRKSEQTSEQRPSKTFKNQV